jgi:nitrite reductase (NADH) small subunit
MLQNSSISDDGFRIVGKVTELEEGKPLRLETEGVSVYTFKGKYYAYRNVCPHQGGPATEGAILPRTQCEILEGGSYKKSLSDDNKSIVCPWHGWEFSLTTGETRGFNRTRLRSYEVRIEGDTIKVRF